MMNKENKQQGKGKSFLAKISSIIHLLLIVGIVVGGIYLISKLLTPTMLKIIMILVVFAFVRLICRLTITIIFQIFKYLFFVAVFYTLIALVV